jgi:phospholipase C
LPAAREALVVGALALLVGLGPRPGAAASPNPCATQARPPARYAHVVLIVLENHSFSEIAGASPYLNKLARTCGLAANYVAVSHPSLPNYLALTSGSTGGITNDCTSCRLNSRSLFEQLGRGWRSYEESLPHAGFLGAAGGSYVKRHNPAAYYPRIAAAYARQDVPLGNPSSGPLADDLRHNRLSRFSLIIPNLCHDEHDCPIATGEAWLRRWIPRILASPAYRSGRTALFITYDEGSRFDNHVYTVIVGSSIHRGIRETRFTHYSLLKTIEELLSLPCLGHACDPGTISMRGSFGLSRNP